MSRAHLINLARSQPTISPASIRLHLSSTNPQPLRLTSLISHWPALSSWQLSDDLKVLRDIVGDHREVEVELGKKGRGYLDPAWQRLTLGFGLFLDAFILKKIPSKGTILPTAYLAQSDLLDLAPNLLNFVPDLPHFEEGPKGTFYRRTMWIGPERSFTPFHRDPYVGLYSQVVGSKTFLLLPPSAEELLSPSHLPRYKNTSTLPVPVSSILGLAIQDVDLLSTDLRDWKDKLSQAFNLAGACQVDLGPGESVLIPEGWWHSAEGGEGAGVGVGAWFR